jgi:dihydroorotase-like cyclic amidohydrolase
MWQCHFGLPGAQTTLTMLLEGVNAGRLTLERVVQLTSETPARLYRLGPRKGSLAPGADADLVLVDLGQAHEIRDEAMLSKAGWTPYAGRRVKGEPVMTFVRGQLVAERGAVVAPPGTGRWVRRLP